MIIKRLLPLFLVLALTLSGCESGEPIYVDFDQNVTGPQGATGATGAQGATGATGANGTFTQNQTGVHLQSPYFWGNITAQNATFSGNVTFASNATGVNTVILGTLNSPGGAVLGTPYTWIKVIAGDGTVVYMPAWK